MGAGQLRRVPAGRPAKEESLPLVARGVPPGLRSCFISTQHRFHAGVDWDWLGRILSFRPRDGPASVFDSARFMTAIPGLGGNLGENNPCEHADKQAGGK